MKARIPDAIRAIALATESVAMWIDAELRTQNVVLHVASTMKEVVDTLTAEAPPHPQILIVDFDAVGPTDVLELHAVRERGWFGAIVALGDASADLRASLHIAHVLPRPLASDVLRDAVASIGLGYQTTKITKLRR